MTNRPAPLGEGREVADVNIARTLSSCSSSHGSANGEHPDGATFQNSSTTATGSFTVPRNGSQPKESTDVVFAPVPSPSPSTSWEGVPCRGVETTVRVQPQMTPHASKTRLGGDEVPILVREDSADRENDHGDSDEEDEAEMVSLEQHRLLLQRKQKTVAGGTVESLSSSNVGDHLRRTPGASMHRSAFLRRTPGASAMHRSAAPARKGGSAPGGEGSGDGAGVDDRQLVTTAPVLGFGLTLSTPVGSRPPSAKGGNDATPVTTNNGGVALSYSSGSSEDHGASVPGGSVPRSAVRPPLNPSSGRHNYVYTPAGMSLAKNPHLSSRDAFSPNAIRLTESLDHLLHEEDEVVGVPAIGRDGHHGVAVSSNGVEICEPGLAECQAANGEDWHEPYTFHENSGTAQEPAIVPRNRNKIGGVKSPLTTFRRGRKSRSSPRASPRGSGGESMINSREGRPIQRNSPRPTQKASAFDRLGSPDSGFGRSNSSGADADECPGPLNFDPSGGGAFAPPTKSKAAPYQPQPGVSIHTPTPKKPQRDQTGTAGPYQPPQQPPQNHGGNGHVHPYVGSHLQQAHVLPFGNERPAGVPDTMNDPYFVPHHQVPEQVGAPGGIVNGHPHAPSPHHFDYVAPHPYGGNHPHAQMVSPVNVPAISPMTIPSFPSTQHQPHIGQYGVVQPQYHGMGSIAHMHQSGPASWSPPPMPPYFNGPGTTQRVDGSIGWQHPVHGGCVDDASRWSSCGGVSNMPPPPTHPIGHMSPPPGSPYTIPSWPECGDYSAGAIGMGAGMVGQSIGGVGHRSHAQHYESTVDFQQTLPPQSRVAAENSHRSSTDTSGRHDFQAGTKHSGDSDYPPQRCIHSNQANIRQNQPKSKNKGAKVSKQSKLLSRKQRNESGLPNGSLASKSNKMLINKGRSLLEREDLQEYTQQQRKPERRSTNNLNSQNLQKKKLTALSPKKKKVQQPGAENTPPQDMDTKEVKGIGSNGASNQDVEPSGDRKNATELKRAELVESPTVRAAFKEFYREFRQKERSSFSEAEEFALRCLGVDRDGAEEDNTLPKQLHWRVHLELADLAKRANRFDEARRLYRKVCTLQPYASQGWLEFSKLEEESGDLDKCACLLNEGLSYCEYNENLLTKAIKHEERMGDLTRARQLLARLKHVGIEQVWRTVLEGALLEARAGNVAMARRVLKYLMHHVPWYGPLYLEAYRLERDADRPFAALAIVERGFREIPRYGPLWFGAFRLCEGMDVAEGDLRLPRTFQMLDRATKSISRELLWKVHLESAQAHERCALMLAAKDSDINLDRQLGDCRRSFANTILSCPPSLCWKVWLAGGRMELMVGRVDEARKLFSRSHEVVPEKGRAAVMLECARLEEFTGDIELARAILCKARSDTGSDWKIWLESIFLELRSGMRTRGIRLANEALQIHSGTGRLWAALVQLRQPDGEVAQMDALKRALWAVPKSGEVWCEGARLHLNPFFPTFGLQEAELHLDFATKFTPQYGDSFLETLRLDLLLKWIHPVAAEVVKNLETAIAETPSHEKTQLWQLVEKHTRDAAKAVIKSGGDRESQSLDAVTAHMLEECETGKFDTSKLELRCSNADPNYGKLWFHCKALPSDTARHVIRRGKSMIAHDIAATAYLYVAASVRREGIALSIKREMHDTEQRKKFAAADNNNDNTADVNEDNELCTSCNKLLERRLREAPSLNELLSDILVDHPISFSGSDFITGLVDLNRGKPLESLSLIERRRTLFGSDLVLSWKPS